MDNQAKFLNPRTRLSPDERSALRRAISAHDGWKAYREATGVKLETMSVDMVWDAADALGINVADMLAAHHAAQDGQPKARTFDRAAMEELRRRLETCGDYMNNRDSALCADILATVFGRQNGEATAAQHEAILSRIIKAEEAAKPADKAEDKPAERPVFAFNAADHTPRNPAPAGDNPAAQLASLIAQMAGQSINPEQVARIVDERIALALSAIPAVRIECKGLDGEVRAIEGHQHPQFKVLLAAACSREANGNPPNIWIAGPAGSSKTHSAKQVAEALGLPFHLHGAAMSAHELFGFVDAGGTYHRTPFREAYEHGGVAVLDEVDAYGPDAYMAMNAALANGQATFPDKAVNRHPSCIIIATANTFGHGATATYVGRTKVDGAFLDRFIKFDWQYDVALEIAISGNERFAKRVIAARRRAEAAGLKIIISPRASQKGASLIAAGLSEDQAAELTYLNGLSAEQRKLVEG